MKIQYCSDLHLEFKENKEFLKVNPIKPTGEILLLAGDIVPFAVMNKYNDFFDELSANFKTVYWIPGNHEYYCSDAAKRSGSFNETIRSNVFLINNIALELNKTKFIFSTLWSKISDYNEWQIERSLSDFQVIEYKKYRFSTTHYNQLHKEAFDFIQSEINKKHSGKTFVVTHHVPTFLNYPEKYKGDILNDAFATEMFDFIEASNVDYWLFGHHHHNAPDFKIGNTAMITNQLGYVRHNEHGKFKTDKIIVC